MKNSPLIELAPCLSPDAIMCACGEPAVYAKGKIGYCLEHASIAFPDRTKRYQSEDQIDTNYYFNRNKKEELKEKHKRFDWLGD